MKVDKLLDNPLTRAAPRLSEWALSQARKIPAVRRLVERELDAMLAGLEDELRPYRGEVRSYPTLPEDGVPHERILADMGTMRDRERERWASGHVSGAVYHGGEAHLELLARVYELYSQANPLHADLWPSVTKFEAEIVAMTARMLGADEVPGADDPREAVCGTVSSGGTESILLAMKAYRDRARSRHGIRHPEMVVPVTAHAAFDKASRYFGIRKIEIPVGPDFRADVEAARAAITANTIVLVGSAPSFPHGVIDPIEELSELARANRVGFHTDACLGGFVLPWARELGAPVPPFDFRLPGVTSMSADTHKYGYAAKGTSVVLYRGRELRHHQYYVTTDWPGGLYFSPTFAGSRPGALSAQCWAAMVSLGRKGYLEATEKILAAGARIREGVAAMDGLRVLGDPLWVIAFAAEDPAALDIYRVLEHMTRAGWSLNGLHRPPCVHIAVTLRHTEPGVVDAFLRDLAAAVEEVRRTPPTGETMAPIYGMAATVPVRGLVGEMLRRYLDLLYRV